MHHGPSERHEHHLAAFERKLLVGALRAPVARFHGHEHDARLDIHQIVGAAVDHAKLEPGAALVRAHQNPLAEADARRRPRHAPEQQAGGHRETQHAHQGFQNGHHVGRRTAGPHVAVSHGTERVRAEEEIVQEPAEFRGRVGALKVAAAKAEIHRREERIGRRVAQQQSQQELRPSHADEVQVRVEVAQDGAVAVHVETSVGIHHAPHGRGELLGQAGIELRVRHSPIMPARRAPGLRDCPPGRAARCAFPRRHPGTPPRCRTAWAAARAAARAPPAAAWFPATPRGP